MPKTAARRNHAIQYPKVNLRALEEQGLEAPGLSAYANVSDSEDEQSQSSEGEVETQEWQTKGKGRSSGGGYIRQESKKKASPPAEPYAGKRQPGLSSRAHSQWLHAHASLIEKKGSVPDSLSRMAFKVGFSKQLRASKQKPSAMPSVTMIYEYLVTEHNRGHFIVDLKTRHSWWSKPAVVAREKRAHQGAALYRAFDGMSLKEVEKRRTKVLAGKGFSSDAAGDGPSVGQFNDNHRALKAAISTFNARNRSRDPFRAARRDSHVAEWGAQALRDMIDMNVGGLDIHVTEAGYLSMLEMHMGFGTPRPADLEHMSMYALSTLARRIKVVLTDSDFHEVQDTFKLWLECRKSNIRDLVASGRRPPSCWRYWAGQVMEYFEFVINPRIYAYLDDHLVAPQLNGANGSFTGTDDHKGVAQCETSPCLRARHCHKLVKPGAAQRIGKKKAAEVGCKPCLLEDLDVCKLGVECYKINPRFQHFHPTNSQKSLMTKIHQARTDSEERVAGEEDGYNEFMMTDWDDDGPPGLVHPSARGVPQQDSGGLEDHGVEEEKEDEPMSSSVIHLRRGEPLAAHFDAHKHRWDKTELMTNSIPTNVEAVVSPTEPQGSADVTVEKGNEAVNSTPAQAEATATLSQPPGPGAVVRVEDHHQDAMFTKINGVVWLRTYGTSVDMDMGLWQKLCRYVATTFRGLAFDDIPVLELDAMREDIVTSSTPIRGTKSYRGKNFVWRMLFKAFRMSDTSLMDLTRGIYTHSMDVEVFETLLDTLLKNHADENAYAKADLGEGSFVFVTYRFNQYLTSARKLSVEFFSAKNFMVTLYTAMYATNIFAIKQQHLLNVLGRPLNMGSLRHQFATTQKIMHGVNFQCSPSTHSGGRGFTTLD